MSNSTKTKTFAKSCGYAVIFLVGQITAGSSVAAEVTAIFGISGTHTDNINKAPEDGQEETIAEGRVTLDIEVARRNFDANIRSKISRYVYTKDSHEDDTVGAFEANISSRFIDDKVHVFVMENFGRALFDPFAPERPENWENINFLSAGIETRFLNFNRVDAGLDLGYSKLDYEVRPFDNQQLEGTIWLGRNIKRNQHLAINLRSERTEFSDSPDAPPIERHSLFLSYDVNANRTDINAEIGYTEQEVAGKESDGITYELNMTRDVGVYSEIALGLVRQYSDDGNIFRYEQGVAREIDDIIDISSTGNPFLLMEFGLTYSLNVGRTALSSRVTIRDQDYEEASDEGRRDYIFSIFGRRNFNSRFWGSFEIDYEKRNFEDRGRDDTSLLGAIGIGVLLSPGITAELSLRRANRDSTSSADEFMENRAYLGLSYTPRWSR